MSGDEQTSDVLAGFLDIFIFFKWLIFPFKSPRTCQMWNIPPAFSSQWWWILRNLCLGKPIKYLRGFWIFIIWINRRPIRIYKKILNTLKDWHVGMPTEWIFHLVWRLTIKSNFACGATWVKNTFRIGFMTLIFPLNSSVLRC